MAYNPDELFMALALEEARLAAAEGEVPVGAVLVKDDVILARAHNECERRADATAHAELLCLQRGMALLGARLSGCTLYATLEPCAMCAGAIILARIAEVYFGAHDPKAGVCGSLMNLLEDTRFNHNPKLFPGLMAEECGALLSGFFRRIREDASNHPKPGPNRN